MSKVTVLLLIASACFFLLYLFYIVKASCTVTHRVEFSMPKSQYETALERKKVTPFKGTGHRLGGTDRRTLPKLPS